MTNDLQVSIGAILPVIILTVWACVLVLVDLAVPKKSKWITASLAALGLVVSAVLCDSQIWQSHRGIWWDGCRG